MSNTVIENKEGKKKKVLHEDVHHYLILRIKEISRLSGVPEWMFSTSMDEYCSEKEQVWVRGFYVHAKTGSGGLCLTGGNSGGVDTRMKAIAAALIRNFIDARLYGLDEVMTLAEDGDLPSPTVMLLPTFYLNGHALPYWRAHRLHELLLMRVMQCKQTVIYVEDFQNMEKDYGAAIAGYVTEHWSRVEIETKK